MEVRAFIYFLEALLQVQAPQANQFTFLSWLMFQRLLTALPEQAKAMGLVVNTAVWNELQVKIDQDIATVRVNLAAAADDEAARTAVDPLLQILEEYLPRIFVPAGWKVVWMGVET